MEAQTLQGFTRWSDPRSPASSDVVPATSTKESVVARGLLPKDRRGVRHLARCGASGCLRRTPSHTAAGEAAGRREHTLVVRRAYARTHLSVQCVGQESHRRAAMGLKASAIVAHAWNVMECTL